MPVERAREGRLCTVRCVGRYESHELEAALDALLHDPELPEDAVILLDLRESESVRDRSVAELREVADYFVGQGPRGRAGPGRQRRVGHAVRPGGGARAVSQRPSPPSSA